MMGSEVKRDDRVRRRFGGNGLHARNTQAARDALRRRQKEKKARIVKRHVRYKEKKKLLEQLTRSERPAPIVATEICRDDEEDPEGTSAYSAKGKASVLNKENREAVGTIVAEDEQGGEKMESEGDVTAKSNAKAADIGLQDDESILQKKSGKKKKFVPFMKEQKEYERLKQEREAQENERRQKIEEREQMLRRSKKERRAKAKQVRKVTPRGQPKLKYQLDAMLARIQKQ